MLAVLLLPVTLTMLPGGTSTIEDLMSLSYPETTEKGVRRRQEPLQHSQARRKQTTGPCLSELWARLRRVDSRQQRLRRTSSLGVFSAFHVLHIGLASRCLTDLM